MSRQRVLRQPRAGRDHDDANDVEDDRTNWWMRRWWLITHTRFESGCCCCLHARKKRTALNEKSKASATVNTTQGKLVVQREAVWVTNVPGLSKPFY